MTTRLEDLASQTQAIVSRGRLRKYYRFRWAGYYGGIATADCVGCCLRCLSCWSWDVTCHPALMSFEDRQVIPALVESLRSIDPRPAGMEEGLLPYPQVMERLTKAGII
jgi:uncharacterized Fe-S cluster-containing radical SAM superfamily protein